jgi:hypothetical protein
MLIPVYLYFFSEVDLWDWDNLLNVNLSLSIFFSEVDLWDWDNLLNVNLSLCKLLIVPNKEVCIYVQSPC